MSADNGVVYDEGKWLIVGDGAIGKTCLLNAVCTDKGFGEDVPDYEPTTFNNFKVKWPIPDGGTYEGEVWDTAGQESFAALRTMSYPGTKVYAVGYSCVSNEKSSFKNVAAKWIPEITESCEPDEDLWMVLVQTKSDMRTGGDPANTVTTAEGQALAEEIGAMAYVETSAMTGDGCNELRAKLRDLGLARERGEEGALYKAPHPDADDVIDSLLENVETMITEDNSYVEPARVAATPEPEPAAAAASSKGTPRPMSKGSGKKIHDNDDGCCVVM